MLVNTKAKVGVFSIALGAYLPQHRHYADFDFFEYIADERFDTVE